MTTKSQTRSGIREYFRSHGIEPRKISVLGEKDVEVTLDGRPQNIHADDMMVGGIKIRLYTPYIH